MKSSQGNLLNEKKFYSQRKEANNKLLTSQLKEK